MRRLALVLLSLIFTSHLFAVDRWIPIAGTVANFRTDTRIFNPSGEKAIEVSVYFLPAGATNNAERVAGTPEKVSVPKRSQVVLDDVVTKLFSTTGIGALLLTSPDEFIATSRIYATVATGTLGQFSEARTPGQASPRGIVIQLKSDSIFRTNIGAVNIANASNEVMWSLYDKTNKRISQVTKSMAAYEVLGPSNVLTFFPNLPANVDLSDAFVTYHASQPLFAYGSSRDLRTDDPIYIPAAVDTGSDPVEEPEQPAEETNTVTVTARGNFTFTINAEKALKRGVKTKFRVLSDGTTHGFALVSPTGEVLIQFDTVTSTAREREITLPASGRYDIICTTFCGDGHFGMVSSVQVSN